MRKRTRLGLANLLTIFLLLVNIMSPLNPIYAEDLTGTDKTSVLTDFSAVIKQNGAVINEGDTFISTDPISIEISFSVPVSGDYPTPANPVNKGDTASFQLSDAFNLISGSTIALNMGSINVAHVTFATDPITKMVTANVVFDGADEVFDGTSDTVTCQFSANFEYDATAAPVTGGDYLVTILEKTFTVTVPPQEIIYDVTKNGTVDLANQQIEWTVNLGATQGEDSIDLGGYIFSDDLTNVGNYVADSFKLNNVTAIPDYADNKLTYTLPADTDSPAVLTFRTAIADAAYYASSQQSITNTGALLDSSLEVMDEGSVTVSFTPKWIEKSGVASDMSTGDYDPTNRTITWTIIVNQSAASLNDVVITDVLPTGLTFSSASWQLWNGTDWEAASAITPNSSGQYDLGDINNKARLVIISNVPDETYTAEKTNYVNNASVSWEGIPVAAPASGNVTVPIGYTAITKNGTADPLNQQIHWTVSVDARGQTIPDLRVYDLLVYGSNSSGFSLSAVTGLPSGLSTSGLSVRYDQRYEEGSFSGAGLTIVVYPLYQDGVRVADLLEITGFTNTEVNSFTFDTVITNPNIFVGNGTSNVYNTAALYTGTVKLVEATKNVSYTNRLLSKELLKRTAMTDPAAGVNSAQTKSLTEAFDYVEKAVIYRLSVNANGLDITNLTNASGTALGTVTVTDTLPEGWEFTEIISGSDYLIFEGNVSTSNPVVTAVDTMPDAVAGLTAEFNGRIATFTFTGLDKPYVILVKAKPSSSTAASYFDSNETNTVRNTLALKTAAWTPGVSTYQDVTINSNILDKSYAVLETGILRWTVDYKPYNLSQVGNRLEDTLPVGLDVRTDASGQLLITGGNITANELLLNADGTYALGSEVDLILGSNVFYNNQTRVLSFVLADSAKGYRFRYITDVTGVPGTVSNQVSLYGTSADQEETSEPYIITASDGTASLQRNGWLSITKVNEDDEPLSGVNFTLYASDGTTVIRTGTTDSEGILKLKVLPDGEYYLKETETIPGYTLDTRTHHVTVVTLGLTVVTSIDDKTGADSNLITIKNYPENTVGNLEITKTVEGNAADQSKMFDFTVVFDAPGSYVYSGNGITDGIIASGDHISLAHGQSITIIGLPKDISYTVTEDDYSIDGYSAYALDASGTIAADETKTAAFVNTRNITPAASPKTNDDNTLTQAKTGIEIFGTGLVLLFGLNFWLRRRHQKNKIKL